MIAAAAGQELWVVLGFGAALTLVLALIRKFGGTTSISVTFARLYGLLSVATLAVGLAVSSAPTDAKTAAFTLLGTIAGYLAGAKPTTVSGGGDDQRGGVDQQTTIL